MIKLWELLDYDGADGTGDISTGMITNNESFADSWRMGKGSTRLISGVLVNSFEEVASARELISIQKLLSRLSKKEIALLEKHFKGTNK